MNPTETIIQRELKLPTKTFILLGPRGTGKSTLIRNSLKNALSINLLRSDQFLPLSQNPSLLWKKVEDVPKGGWVFIDEIQKIPSLLDEIHAVYEEKKIQFALSGSSARKLKRAGVNLLAGRALSIEIFPFTHSEIKNNLTVLERLEWGTLPLVFSNSQYKEDTLFSYVNTYLKQELMEEGLIRKLEPFARFLKIAGLYNGQILNIENIARESHLSRSTVEKYFELLEDTLIGYRLPSLQIGLNSKETTHPKFYLFDSGVARACAGLLREELDSIWLGFALETYFLHELKAYFSYQKKSYSLYYYRYSSGYEIDFVIETKKKTISHPQEVVLIEIKSSKKWDKRWSDSMLDFKSKSKKTVRACYGVYLGKEELSTPEVKILPLLNFLNKLKNNELF